MFIAGPIGSCLASVAASCACTACSCISREVLRKSARLAYCVLFLLGMIAAWILRDFAKPLIEKIPWIMRDIADIHPSDNWFGVQAVYRISMGQFMFFSTFSLVLLGVRYKSDKRDQYLHHGHWLLKLGLWLLFTALPFFFPNNLIMAYGWLARIGSGMFLVMQMIILLDFTQTWNEAWVEEGESDSRWLWGLMGATVACFVAVLGVSGGLFYWFNPPGAGSCSLNISLITLNLLLAVVLSGLSLHPSATTGSLFPASAISLYCTYLLYSALQSEPHDYQCNGLAKRMTAASASTLAVGMLLTLVSVVYSAFRAGSNSKLFSLSDDEDTLPTSRPLLEEPLTSAGLDGRPDQPPGEVTADSTAAAHRSSAAEDEFATTTYNYSFFHFVFALASMYIGMLMTGWGTGVEQKDMIDVGWASVWVKITAEWVAAGLYAWSLVAPVLFPDREFY